jgi:ribosomal protein L6P/L9E
MLVLSRLKCAEITVFAMRTFVLNSIVTYLSGPAGVVRVILPFYYCLIIQQQNNLFQLKIFNAITSSIKELGSAKALLNLAFNRVCFQNYLGLKTIGVGYKFVSSAANRYLFIIVGLTHLLVHRLNFYTKVTKIKKKKRLLILSSLKFQDFTNEGKIIRCLRPPDVYCGKGLRFFHERYLLKEGKKQVR